MLALFGLVMSELGDRMRVGAGVTSYDQAHVPATWTFWFVGATAAFVVVNGEVSTRLQATEGPVIGRARDAAGALGSCLAVWALSTALPFDRGLTVTVALFAIAVMGWASFERTRAGLIMGIGSAMSGTLAEMLFAGQGWFRYTDVLRHMGNVPAWLPPLYFSAGVAVSQLTRAINGALRADK